MDLQTFLIRFVVFLNTTFIPFLLAFAFIMFLWNMTRYFIIEGANEKEHEKAKSFALYSIAAFVVITSIWGIVNLFTGGFGFTSNQQITPDYIKNGGIGSSGGGGSWNLPWSGNNSGSGSSGNSSGGGWWIPTSIIGDGTGSETNINTTGSEMGGNDYYYMNNNTNNGGETNINTTGSEVGGNDYYYMNNNTNNGGSGDKNYPYPEDAPSTNSENQNNWDNYGYVDGPDTSISPDP